MKKVLFALAMVFGFEPLAKSEVVGKAYFHAVGRGLALDCDGEAEGVAVEGIKVEAGKLLAGKFSVKIAAFKTGISLRDSHFQDLLKAKQSPLIEFIPTLPLDLKDGGPFAGDLKMAGVTKKVSGKLSVSGKKVTFTGPIKLSDFKVEAPNYKGTKMDDLVEVRVEANIL